MRIILKAPLAAGLSVVAPVDALRNEDALATPFRLSFHSLKLFTIRTDHAAKLSQVSDVYVS